jgi:hypothetical protein
VRVAAGPAGARVEATGAAVAAPTRLAAGERATVLAGSVAGGPAEVCVVATGPVGVWHLRVGRTEGRVGAARGMELTLQEDGSCDLTLADAFVGPTTGGALDLASRFGVSGLLLGTWRVIAYDGDAPIVQLGPVRSEAITVHPRGRRGFAMPAGPILGATQGWLDRAAGTRWRIQPTEAGFEAVSSDVGPPVTLVFGKSR